MRPTQIVHVTPPTIATRTKLKDFSVDETVDWLASAVPQLSAKTIQALRDGNVTGAFLVKHRAFGDLISELMEKKVVLGPASAIDVAVRDRINKE